jgi:HlyD family secretion protein
MLGGLLLPLGCDPSGAETTLPAVSSRRVEPTRVTALGRLEPEDGIRRVAGPSGGVPVISELRVDKGDRVEAKDVIAVLDTQPMRAARVVRLEAELANAQRELDRASTLNTNRVVSDSRKDEWETKVRVIRAEIREARAELARAFVRSPIGGRVLYVHARPGERVGVDGIVELGNTNAMFAIAEVYEDDIGRVEVGQRARVTSPVFPGALEGSVEWIHLKVAKQDALGTDPAARKDARVVEVEIRLDDSEAAARLTHLQVEVEIEL